MYGLHFQDHALVKEHFDHQKAETQREQMRNEIDRMKRLLEKNDTVVHKQVFICSPCRCCCCCCPLPTECNTQPVSAATRGSYKRENDAPLLFFMPCLS